MINTKTQLGCHMFRVFTFGILVCPDILNIQDVSMSKNGEIGNMRSS